MCCCELPSHFLASAQPAYSSSKSSLLYIHHEYVFSVSPKDFACMKLDPSVDQFRLTELPLHSASMWQAALDHNGLIASVSSILNMLKKAILMSRSICSASHDIISLLAHDDSAVVDDVAPPRRRHCERCAWRGEDALSRPDVAAVMASLGLVIGRNDEEEEEEEEEDEQVCGVCEAMGAVEELMKSKVGGEGELREAFYVFDRDEDGFVCAAELWNVLRRLGMEEGARYKDCQSMIAAYDGDGDGRISFHEFRAMMENAV